MIRYFWPSDDEQLAGQWQDSHFDEDGGWWANVQQCGAALALVVAATLTASSTAVAQGVFPQQDDPAGFLNNTPFAQEEYAQPLVPPYNWPQPSVFTDDDVHVQFVQTFVPDDGDTWHQLVPPVPDSNLVQLPFLDLKDFPQFPAANNPLDDGPVWTQNTPWDPYWTLLFFLDDGSAVPVFQYDEDFWPQNLQNSYNWPQPAQPFMSSDEDNQPQEFVAAEDPLWLQLTRSDPGSLLWPQQFTFEQQETATLVGFAEEFFWQNPTPAVADSLLWPQPFQFEQNDATGALSIGNDPDSLQPLLVFPVADSLLPLQPFTFDPVDILPSAQFTEEHYWIPPIQPVADSLIWPQQFAFEQTDATGSLAKVIDELYAPSLVYPTTAELRAFQQWEQRQDDPAGSLYMLLDEVYAPALVAPYNWPQPSVFVADEQIVAQPSAGIDEVYWPGFVTPFVPPVQASLYLDLPLGCGFGLLTDPEEIPAGSLFAQTPPQVVPCTPPAGFDKDTSITYFGGNKNPTQVLLCRICNSGKPLLVRGDYAIWCQDCCAFVSKSDTVMGTVRAPGTFRGRF